VGERGERQSRKKKKVRGEAVLTWGNSKAFPYRKEKGKKTIGNQKRGGQPINPLSFGKTRKKINKWSTVWKKKKKESVGQGGT